MREEDSRILIVKEKPRRDFCGNVLGMPKGVARLRDKEFLDAACRELLEETGISARDAEIMPIEFITFHGYFREILIMFPIIIKNPPEPKPDKREVAECQWLSIDELVMLENDESAVMRSLIADLRLFLDIGIPQPDDRAN